MTSQHSSIALSVTALERGKQTQHIDGIAVYTRELIQAMSPYLSHINVSMQLAGFGELASGSAVHCLDRYFYKHILMAYVFAQSYSSRRFKHRPILFHATDHYIPRFADIPVIATIMDIIPLLHEEWVSTRLRGIKNYFFKKTMLYADHVITISEHSKRDLIEHLGIASEQISVTPLGVNPIYFHQLEGIARQKRLATYGLLPGFFLFIGTLQPRKNIEGAIQAHSRLPLSVQKKHPLVIVGRAGKVADPVIQAIEKGKQQGTVVWFNHVPDEDVRVFLQSALALVYVSLYEGFGLPILEAFASRCPVITSNVTSIPEVAGDAAYLVNPYHIEAISDLMLEVIEDTTALLQKVTQGYERAAHFSWDNCALETLKVYQKVAKVPPINN